MKAIHVIERGPERMVRLMEEFAQDHPLLQAAVEASKAAEVAEEQRWLNLLARYSNELIRDGLIGIEGL